MSIIIDRVQLAITALQQGKMVILTDDPDRENEGDLIFPAETITPAIMNFIIRNSSGIVCLSLLEEQLKKLQLPFMVPFEQNTSCRGTPFTISIDAKDGVTTGVSASDRVKTVLAAIHETTTPADLVRPGHIFPLQAKAGGVLERKGHTEGALDLIKLAGFKPAAVLCEVMNADGTMSSGDDLTAFALQHDIPMVSIAELIDYRLRHENFIIEEAQTFLPLAQYGEFTMTVIKESLSGNEHIVLEKPSANVNVSSLVRVHSSCITGDLFASLRCDCQQQLQHSLQRISEEGGLLIYLNQEGRGIGLLNKIKAYALQEQGLDTVTANEKLGLPVDARSYHVAANILRNRKIRHIRLLTNNPSKVADLEKQGISVSVEAMPTFMTEHNHHYLKTKKEKLNHLVGV